MRILATGPDVNDATSFYRNCWPLARMIRDGYGIHVDLRKLNQDISLGWAELSFYDILFVQRAYTGWNYELIMLAQEAGLKVWVDYDDDLFNVPPHNPAFATYADPKTKDTIARIIRAADLVTFSTEYLKQVMNSGSEKCHVVRNATDFRFIDSMRPTDNSKLENIIFWRGSKTHHEDLFCHAKAMGEIAKEFPKWKYVFLGSPWFGLSKFIPEKQFITLPPVKLPKYFYFLNSLRPDISIVPLEDIKFNHSKSNIAWQEATIAQSPCLVPTWQEWAVPGAATYETPDDFYKQLRALIMRKELRDAVTKLSCDTIRKDFQLVDRNVERMRLLEAIF